jgi:SAM-dependent methyltransferase
MSQNPLTTALKQLAEQRPELVSHPDWPRYQRQFQDYVEAHQKSPASGEFNAFTFYPCLGDNLPTTPVDPYYFYQDTWAAKKIFTCRPKSVVDVGSTVLYAGIVSQFVPTTFVDIRPPNLQMSGLNVVPGSILNLPFESGSQEFITSLCVIEHIGLGRYGDPIDPDGTRKACAELDRVLAPSGSLVLSVPLGPPCIAFNAHRIFSREQILSYFPSYQVLDEAYLAPHPTSPEVIAKLSTGDFVVWVAHLQKGADDRLPNLALPADLAIPPSPLTKQTAVKRVAELYSLSVLVETGTYLGDMIDACLFNFSKIISIELSEDLYIRASNRFQDKQHVTILQGDSGKVLRSLVPRLDSPCLYWLDGHYSSGITARGQKDTPILEELNVIGTSRYSLQSAILIDDARCFDGAGDYPSVEEIRQLCLSLFPCHNFFVSHDIIFVLPKK